jgi:PhoPQ-activated pathogenicity-related protein
MEVIMTQSSLRMTELRFLVFALISSGLCAAAFADETALDRYIAKPDPAFAWQLLNTVPGDGHTAFVLKLTSQTWRSDADVDRPTWEHSLTIVRPESPRPGTAILFIGGGSNRDVAPQAASERAIRLAVDSNSVVAELGQVPNQPLSFSDSKDARRSEDDLIAYSRVRYMATHDETWLVRLAMVKSGVRALDAVQQFLASDAGGRIRIDRFVVSGGSKRGWTSWLVAAVDPRVNAVIPVVIDALNSEVITRHHYEAYGFFSPALKDYVNHGLFPHKIGTPGYREILAIEDPYNYRQRDRLKIPKYLINASGDQFFLPDNSQFYFPVLEGEKYLRYVPNAKHSLEGTDARQSLQAFYQAILDGRPRPVFEWKKLGDGSLRVTARDKPARVTLWQATNPQARDFRVDTIGNAYTSSPLDADARGVYTARLIPPDRGFTAFFVELEYESGGKYPFKFTTEVSVVPDRLPFRFEDALKAKP